MCAFPSGYQRDQVQIPGEFTVPTFTFGINSSLGPADKG